MSKNPFSLYDFMGYLFPGLFFIIIMVYVFNDAFDVANIFRMKALVDAVGIGGTTFDLDKSILIVILGYVTGHFVAYASSLTIESFANNIFGYPSKYLLHGNEQTWWHMLKKCFQCQASSSKKTILKIKVASKVLLKAMMFLFLFPISFMVFTIGWLIDINSYITRSIDDYLRTAILQKQYELAQELKIEHADVNTKCDYHRLVMHYVYTHIPECQRKVDNYISLYGFLRAISFVFCICFDCCLIYAIKGIDIHASIDLRIITELCILYAMCILSFLGFIKFYRRYTLENLMSLLVGLKLDKNDKKDKAIQL